LQVTTASTLGALAVDCGLAHSGEAVRRSVVPLKELLASHEEFARQLADLPEGQTVRLRVTAD
jgi:hypothetical protein